VNRVVNLAIGFAIGNPSNQGGESIIFALQVLFV